MAQVKTKENMTISIREYTDNQGQSKKVWKTIGELITWDDGSQSFELWGPTGSTKGNVFSKDDNNTQGAQNQGQQNTGGFQQQSPQQSYNQNTGTQGGYQQNQQR